jgi:hypothetical protein
MNQFDSNKDYYGVLGVDKDASPREIEREYKRQAARHHPDRGGSEEQMKSVNEAYGVLKNASLRREYDERRRDYDEQGEYDERGREYDESRTRTRARDFAHVSTPTARDVGAMGQVLSAGLCLGAGLFLLLLVRTQWIWFLWPLAILAVFVVAFGVLLARSAMVAVNASLPVTNRLKRHTKLQEIAFWAVIVTTGYGLYILLSY